MVFEVHAADLVIDGETWDIVEIHVSTNEYRAPELVEYLRGKGILEHPGHLPGKHWNHP